MAEAPSVIAKKVGNFYYTFHRKGQFRERTILPTACIMDVKSPTRRKPRPIENGKTR